MSRFKVHVCRIAYSHADIIVEAKTEKQAMKQAENVVGNHEFPSENSSTYKAQGATKLDFIFEGTVEVLCHQISFFYRSEKPIPKSLHERLKEEAYDRAKHCIYREETNQGELNYEDDKHSYTGWWKIV